MMVQKSVSVPSMCQYVQAGPTGETVQLKQWGRQKRTVLYQRSTGIEYQADQEAFEIPYDETLVVAEQPPDK